MEIDEQNIDGKDITDANCELLDLPKIVLDRNKRLLSLAGQVMKHGPKVDFDNLSGVDSDDLIPTKEDIEMGEDIDGIELSENDFIFKPHRSDSAGE